MKLERFEGHFSPKYFHNATGMDILRILNLNTLKSDNKGYNKNDEADILKRKSNNFLLFNFTLLIYRVVKNSDIKNFEKHMNNYLNFIRKNNKDIQNFHKTDVNNPVFYDKNEDFLIIKITNESDDKISKCILKLNS